MKKAGKNREKTAAEESPGKLLSFPKKDWPEPEGDQGKKTILVVDDEPHMVRLLRLNLEPEGYQVLEATDGEQAYAMTLEKRPDVVLLDVIVPKKSGIEVCKAIKTNPDTAEIPVILITARGEGMRTAGLESGADLFLTKPFSPLRLLAEIRRMAERR